MAKKPESDLSESAVDAVVAPAAVTAPTVSGLYRWSPTPYSRRVEELRLDVDGFDPQSTASGTVRATAAAVQHWIANLVADGANVWKGQVWYVDGAGPIVPGLEITIRVTRPSAANPLATVSFDYAAGVVTRAYAWRSRYFRAVNFEFDYVEGEQPVLSKQTCAHPNRPAGLACETLTIPTVFRRAGFDTAVSSRSGPIPVAGAGIDRLWSDREMHDAMQAHWSRFRDAPAWALWVLFAPLHVPDDPGEPPENLGGIMFDDMGTNHRQGTAIFTRSFISQPDPADPNPQAWARRMAFWCAVHEMGHAFNLAHSWQKGLGGGWIDLDDEPEARSFMNYPYNVAGGETAFFDDFAYRFSDTELTFMRHAPERFVEMGNAAWFDDHAFDFAAVPARPSLELVVRVNRASAEYEFMEPVTLELKLTNRSREPRLIDRYALRPGHGLTVILKKDGKPARQFAPYARQCRSRTTDVLGPGESKYESLYVSSGVNGWDLAEPGHYTVQAALHLGEEDVVSAPLRLRVAPPRGYDEEYLAQDFFSEDVGRIVAFDGSRVLDGGNAVLHEVAGKLADRRVGRHAALALGESLAYDGKRIDEGTHRITVARADPAAARKLIDRALVKGANTMAESLGHIDYRWYVERFAEWLAARGDGAAGYAAQDTLLKTLAQRTVRGRKVKDEVLAEVKAKRDAIGARARPRARRKK